jgi:hypothetical protein
MLNPSWLWEMLFEFLVALGGDFATLIYEQTGNSGCSGINGENGHRLRLSKE